MKLCRFAEKQKKRRHRKEQGCGKNDARFVEDEPKVISKERRCWFPKPSTRTTYSTCTELKKKQAAGTLTDAEKKQLERMEEMKKRFEQNRRGEGRPEGAPAKADERDARKRPQGEEKKKEDKK